jgi:hypothetical protein
LALPEPIAISPVVPQLEVPVFNEMEPLVPDEPAFAVSILMYPL